MIARIYSSALALASLRMECRKTYFTIHNVKLLATLDAAKKEKQEKTTES